MKIPITFVVTDKCLRGLYAFGRTHFDMSGYAFGRMVVVDKTTMILNNGEIPILYR
jgi:hypothetical protein